MGIDMTDLEMVKLCADRLDYLEVLKYSNAIYARDNDGIHTFNPLTNDAQALALVKRFEMQIITGYSNGWIVSVNRGRNDAQNENLNRAIVECVARLP